MHCEKHGFPGMLKALLMQWNIKGHVHHSSVVLLKPPAQPTIVLSCRGHGVHAACPAESTGTGHCAAG